MELARLTGRPKYVTRSLRCQIEVDNQQHEQEIRALDVYIGQTIFGRFHALNTFLYCFGDSQDNKYNHIRQIDDDGQTRFIKASLMLSDELYEVATYIHSPVIDSATLRWYRRVGELAKLSLALLPDESDDHVNIMIDNQTQSALGIGFVHVIDEATLTKLPDKLSQPVQKNQLALVHSAETPEQPPVSLAHANLRLVTD